MSYTSKILLDNRSDTRFKKYFKYQTPAEQTQCMNDRARSYLQFAVTYRLQEGI